MAVDHVKSAIITSLDATPQVQATAGEGGPAPLQHVEGHAVAVASSSADATYQLARVPWTAKIKRIMFESADQVAGKFDLGLYYSSEKGTALLAAAAVDQDFFATALETAGGFARADVTNESGTYTIDKRQQPLWQAVGLTKDPGGFADIVATVKTTAVTTGTGRLGVAVDYTN